MVNKGHIQCKVKSQWPLHHHRRVVLKLFYLTLILAPLQNWVQWPSPVSRSGQHSLPLRGSDPAMRLWRHKGPQAAWGNQSDPGGGGGVVAGASLVLRKRPVHALQLTPSPPTTPHTQYVLCTLGSVGSLPCSLRGAWLLRTTASPPLTTTAPEFGAIPMLHHRGGG